MNSKSPGVRAGGPAAPLQRSRRATSYDVARLAGVSQSAVSRAFSKDAPVSDETRARVRDAARRLGYAPSNVARSLITRRSRTLGVVVTETTTRNYPDVLFHLGQEIQSTGNRMLVFTLAGDEGAEALLEDLLAYHVDGVISGATMPQAMLETLAHQHIPVVFYNRVARGGKASAVGCDHDTAMEDLVAHLALGGLERAAFLAGPEGAPVSDDRLAGVRLALAKRGMEIERVARADYSYDGGRAAASVLLGGSPRPDTLICANDAMALGALDACRHDLALRVPDDVAVSGFDDIPQAAWPSYDLTTLHQPVGVMSRSAVRMVIEMAGGEGPGRERRLMRAELRPRGSTRPVPASSDQDPLPQHEALRTPGNAHDLNIRSENLSAQQ